MYLFAFQKLNELHDARWAFQQQQSRNHSPGRRSPGRNPYVKTYELPEDFDRTPNVLKPLLPKVDNYIQDKFIISLIYAMYVNVTSTWATDCPEDAKLYFTGPVYGPTVKSVLGYRDEEMSMYFGNVQEESNSLHDT